MDKAIEYKHLHPSTSLTELANRTGIPRSTLHDRITNTHLPRGHRTNRNLSIIEEEALLNKITAYADRGTLLTPKNITTMATGLCGHAIGVNWTSTFLHRHKDKISSRFYRVQEIARLRADTPENRGAFLTLVCPFGALKLAC